MDRELADMTDVYWLEQVDVDLPAENDWLSSAELSRLKSMRIANRRNDWRLGRWTAKRALATYLNLPTDTRTLAKFEFFRRHPVLRKHSSPTILRPCRFQSAIGWVQRFALWLLLTRFLVAIWN